MTRRTINVIIGIVLAFIVVFFGGSFAYQSYQDKLSDERSQLTKEEQEEQEKENSSGLTNEESKYN